MRVGIPHGHGKTTPFVAGLRTTALVAPFVLDGPINRAAFETSVAKGLGPELRRGDVVVMDNLSSHKGPRVQEDRGSRREPALPSARQPRPEGPRQRLPSARDAFAKRKALLRKAAERTIEGLWTAIGGLLETFTPDECANSFAAAGYDAT